MSVAKLLVSIEEDGVAADGVVDDDSVVVEDDAVAGVVASTLSDLSFF